MSMLAMTYPVQAAVPAVQTVLRAALLVARPLFGLGAMMTVLLAFKPMLAGFLRAIKLTFVPRLSREERKGRLAMQASLLLNRMAREVEPNQPNFAAELRYLASHD